MGKAAPALVNLLIIILGVRVLGEAEFGRYSLVYWSLMLVHSFSIGWVKQGILRFYKAEQAKLSNPKSIFLSLSLLSTIIALVAFIFIAVVLVPMSSTELLTCLMFLALFNIFIFRTTLFQAQLKSVQFAWMEVLYYLGAFGLFVVATQVLEITSFLSIIGANAVALIGTFVLFSLVDKGFIIKPKLGNKALVKQTMSFGFPMSLWLFGSLLFNISDRYLIESFIDLEAVGKYSAVADLAFKVSGFVCMPALLAIHPRMVDLWVKKDYQPALKLMYKGIAGVTTLMLLFTALLPLFQPVLFDKVLQTQIEPGYFLTVPLVLGGFLWQAAQLIHKPLEMTLHQRPMLIAIGVSLIANIAGNIVLLPKLGYVAAGYTTLAGMLVYICIVLLANKKALKNFKPKTV